MDIGDVFSYSIRSAYLKVEVRIIKPDLSRYLSVCKGQHIITLFQEIEKNRESFPNKSE